MAHNQTTLSGLSEEYVSNNGDRLKEFFSKKRDVVGLMIDRLRGMTFLDLGKKYGISGGRVMQIEMKALWILKDSSIFKKPTGQRKHPESLEFLPHLSTRTKKVLGDNSVRTLGGIIRYYEEDYMNIRGLGKKGVSEIKACVGEMGFKLKSRLPISA